MRTVWRPLHGELRAPLRARGKGNQYGMAEDSDVEGGALVLLWGLVSVFRASVRQGRRQERVGSMEAGKGSRQE